MCMCVSVCGCRWVDCVWEHARMDKCVGDYVYVLCGYFSVVSVCLLIYLLSILLSGHIYEVFLPW